MSKKEKRNDIFATVFWIFTIIMVAFGVYHIIRFLKLPDTALTSAITTVYIYAALALSDIHKKKLAEKEKELSELEHKHNKLQESYDSLRRIFDERVGV